MHVVSPLGDCPICFLEKTLIISHCRHAVCSECLDRQLVYDARCSICRAMLRGIHPPLPKPTVPHVTLAIRRSRVTAPLGLTFSEKNNKIVIDVVKGVARAAGCRVGDCVLRVNGIPCYSVKCTLQLLKAPVRRVEMVVERNDAVRRRCDGCQIL